MPYRVSSGESSFCPWTVIDTEAPAGSYVSGYATAAEARAVCRRLNLEAATHDLLAALEVVVAVAAHDWGDDHPAIIQARTAIAKAKGN